MRPPVWLMLSRLFPGCNVDITEYPFDSQYDDFTFNSLLTREESISAIGMVRTECNKVVIMSLFHIPTTKPMRLEEFEQTQSQATSQVCVLIYLIGTCIIHLKGSCINSPQSASMCISSPHATTQIPGLEANF